MNLSNWQLTYTTPWIKMAKRVKKSIEMGKRPSPVDRRGIIRIVVDDIRLKCLNPTRKQLLYVAFKCVEAHPDSFQDRDDEGTIIGSGSLSLLNQLKSRVEKQNRNKTSSSNLKRSCQEKNVSDYSSEKIVKKADSYGCISWQPGLPEDTSESELREQQKEIGLIFKTGPEQWTFSAIDELMGSTYYLQRSDLNSQPTPSITTLKVNWSFPFGERWLLSHFNCLVGVDLRDKIIPNSKTSKGKSFMENTARNNSRQEMKEIINAAALCEDRTMEMATVILLLMAYLKDERESFITLADSTSAVADIVVGDLPASPCLIVVLDPCCEGPCQNGGTCLDPTTSTYTCTCLPGFQGTNCQTNIDDCVTSPCQNSGTCQDLVNDYSCTCVAGWEGKNCDINIDDCAVIPCQNGGTCADLVNDHWCACAAGWEGKNCDTNINERAPGPCQNGATYAEDIIRYTCIYINECVSGPCENGATCVDGINRYTCTCGAGWTGTNCDITEDTVVEDDTVAGMSIIVFSIVVAALVISVIALVIVVCICRRHRQKATEDTYAHTTRPTDQSEVYTELDYAAPPTLPNRDGAKDDGYLQPIHQ